MRSLWHLAALVLGAVVALAAVVVHRVDALGIPVGLGLAVVASLGTAWHLRRGSVPRSTASYCLGWLLVLGVALVGKPEGDYALAGDPSGYTLMGTGLFLVVIGAASLPVGAKPPAT